MSSVSHPCSVALTVEPGFFPLFPSQDQMAQSPQMVACCVRAGRTKQASQRVEEAAFWKAWLVLRMEGDPPCPPNTRHRGLGEPRLVPDPVYSMSCVGFIYSFIFEFITCSAKSYLEPLGAV